MKAVVTGAAGFIGSRLSQALIDEGFDVVGIDCLTDYYSLDQKGANVGRLSTTSAFTFVEDDLLSMDLTKILAGKPFVFHLAGQPGVRSSWGDGFQDYLRNNVAATQHLLEASQLAGIRRLVYSSSSSVYGESLTHPTPESAPTRPRSPYGVTKLAAEHLVSLYASNWGMETVSLRYFTVYGRGQRPDMAIERLVRSVQTGTPFKVFGDGGQTRDFTHVTDVVRANIAAALTEGTSGEIFNIAGGSHASLADVIGIVEKVTGREVPLVYEPVAAGDVRVTSASTQKALNVLGWAPSITLGDGIAEQAAPEELVGRDDG